MSLLDKTDLKIDIGTEKNFGLVFSAVCFIVCIYFWLNEMNIYLFFLIGSFILMCFAFFYPKILMVPNKIWFKFGLLLGMIVSPIVMGIIFFFNSNTYGYYNAFIRERYSEAKKNTAEEPARPDGPRAQAILRRVVRF